MMKQSVRKFFMNDIGAEVIVEVASRKEVLSWLDGYVDYCCEDDCFEILYNDGTVDIIDYEYDGHKIKRQNIASIVYANSATYMVYGNFEMNENGIAYAAFEEKIDSNLVEIA